MRLLLFGSHSALAEENEYHPATPQSQRRRIVDDRGRGPSERPNVTVHPWLALEREAISRAELTHAYVARNSGCRRVRELTDLTFASWPHSDSSVFRRTAKAYQVVANPAVAASNRNAPWSWINVSFIPPDCRFHITRICRKHVRMRQRMSREQKKIVASNGAAINSSTSHRAVRTIKLGDVVPVRFFAGKRYPHLTESVGASGSSPPPRASGGCAALYRAEISSEGGVQHLVDSSYRVSSP